MSFLDNITSKVKEIANDEELKHNIADLGKGFSNKYNGGIFGGTFCGGGMGAVMGDDNVKGDASKVGKGLFSHFKDGDKKEENAATDATGKINASDYSATRSGELKVDNQDNGLVHMTLNRPEALNSLTLSLHESICPLVDSLAKDENCSAILVTGEGAKAFCAGGDIKLVLDKKENSLHVLSCEYKMVYSVSVFPKPYISLWHGIVMGAGVGLSIFGSHRVACEKTIFAMPECHIGISPDVGMAHIFPKLDKFTPGLGLFAGLTSYHFNGTDCLKYGLATHYATSDKMSKIEQALKSADLKEKDAVDKLLDSFQEKPTQEPSLDAEALQFISDCFGQAKSVLQIKEKIKDHSSEIAIFTQKAFERNCPLGMAAFFEAMKRSVEGNFSIKQALEQDYKVLSTFMEVDDWNFKQGVTCTLVDKSKEPEWRPGTIEEVTKEQVEKVFEGVKGNDLVLP